jgi:FkbM family methyltransferase
MYPWLTWFEVPGDSRYAVKVGSIVSANDGDVCLAAVSQCLLKDKKENLLVIDIGFAQGWWSCFCCEYFPNIRAIGFEPNEESYTQALEHLKVYPQIQLFNLAISDHFGVLPFAMRGEESNSRISQEEATTIVACDTLKSFIKDEQVALLKIDTEGHDMIILESIFPYISQIKNLVFEFTLYWYGTEQGPAIQNGLNWFTKISKVYRHIYGLSRRGEPTLYTFLTKEDILWFLNMAWSHKYQIDILCTNEELSELKKLSIQKLFSGR